MKNTNIPIGPIFEGDVKLSKRLKPITETIINEKIIFLSISIIYHILDSAQRTNKSKIPYDAII